MPASAAGRWNGVSVRKVKMPEMSGWPSGVRIADAASVDWAAAGDTTIAVSARAARNEPGVPYL